MRITNSFEILFEVTLHKYTQCLRHTYTHTQSHVHTHTRCLTRTLRLAAQCPDAENLSKTRRQNVKNLSFCLLCYHFPLTLTIFPFLSLTLSLLLLLFISIFSIPHTDAKLGQLREFFPLSPSPTRLQHSKILAQYSPSMFEGGDI